jgi:sigma-B regulation protein RsbU (phosphoserine phosphatase)
MNILPDELPCLFLGFDDNGIIQATNENLCNTLGYSKEQLLGNKADQLFTIATRIFNQTHLFPLLKIQGYANEIFITLKSASNEEVPLLINASIKQSDDKHYTLITGIIVHNRKKYEDEIIAARRAAENALNDNTALVQIKEELQNRVEQLDSQIYMAKKQNEELRQFNRVVTHDLEEPLRKLLVFSDIFLQNNQTTASHPLAEKIRRVSQQMRSTVSGLQQYVWLTEPSLRIVDVNLNTLLLSVKQKIEAEQPSLQLELITERLPSTEGDREQLFVLMYELLANAARFRKPGNAATIYVHSRVLQLNKFRSIEGKYKYSDFLRLQMHDEGIGFDPTYKSQLFDLFKGVHDSSGKGVGLSLCKKVVENHYGDISINGRKNEGTTVTLLLPMRQHEQNSTGVNFALTEVNDNEQL